MWIWEAERPSPAASHVATGLSVQGLAREGHATRQGHEVDSALAMAVRFSFFPEPQQTVLDIYNTKDAGSRMKNRANVLDGAKLEPG